MDTKSLKRSLFDMYRKWFFLWKLQPHSFTLGRYIVATKVLDSVDHSNDIRIRNAQLLDEGLKDLEEYIDFPERSSKYKDVYQLYVIQAKKRDQLVEYLQSQEI